MRKITNRKLLNQVIHTESYIPNLIIIIENNLNSLNILMGDNQKESMQGIMRTEPIKLKDLIKTCYFPVESAVPSTINWKRVIGTGTYGLILPTLIEPLKWVVKIANKSASCTTMDHEKNLQQSAVQALYKFKKYTNFPIFCPEIKSKKIVNFFFINTLDVMNVPLPS